ncbi:splicing factor 45-like [Haliotis asinina]|uniref:splicing factor 45-like n=1 Tax=Haliotis asinina TaxID=109174 RepID=UPI003532362D
MSLYDGLDLDNTEGGISNNVDSGWSSGFKLLQSQLQAKKANLTTPKRPRQGSILAPVIDLKRNEASELHFNLQTGKLERADQPSTPPVSSTAPFIASDPVPSITGVQDEYDPFRPNEYEDIVKKRREAKQKEREEEKRREAEEGRSSRRRPERERERDRDRGREDDGEMDRAKRRREQEEEEEGYEKPRSSGAAIAPPMSLLEDNAPPKEATEPVMPNRSNSPPTGYTLGLGGSVASRIMAKYGYKEGQGLGKQEQGMSTALFVEKTSKRGGKIIHEKDLPKEVPRESPSNTNLLRNPSKVILLRNMVGPGEVDEDLEPETAEECSKYGKVIKCIIFEIPGQVEEEAVRIFVEFERMESAIKALVDLNGRYFGGKIVKACFYNLDKFRRLDLADPSD